MTGFGRVQDRNHTVCVTSLEMPFAEQFAVVGGVNNERVVESTGPAQGIQDLAEAMIQPADIRPVPQHRPTAFPRAQFPERVAPFAVAAVQEFRLLEKRTQVRVRFLRPGGSTMSGIVSRS